jgi:hypothetical protein
MAEHYRFKILSQLFGMKMMMCRWCGIFGTDSAVARAAGGRVPRKHSRLRSPEGGSAGGSGQEEPRTKRTEKKETNRQETNGRRGLENIRGLGKLNLGRFIASYSDVLPLNVVPSELFTRHDLPVLLAHMGLEGNEIVGARSRHAALNGAVFEIPLPPMDFQGLARFVLLREWQKKWDGADTSRFAH